MREGGMHNVVLLRRFIILAFRKLTVFRVNFYMLCFHFIFYFSFFIFWKSLFSFIDSFGTWTFPELALLTCFSFFFETILVIFLGLDNMPGKIVRGDIDKYLCRPINPVLGVIGEDIYIGFVQLLFTGLTILGILIANYNIYTGIVNLLIAFGLALWGGALFLLLNGALCLSAFWLGRVDHLQSIFWQTKSFSKYPVTEFPNLGRVLLTYIVPVGLYSAIPTMAFLDRIENYQYILIVYVVLTVILVTLYKILVKKGFDRYESYGG